MFGKCGRSRRAKTRSERCSLAGRETRSFYKGLQSLGPRRCDRKGNAVNNDGVKDFGYATDNAGWTKSDRAILIWSPDSKKIATFQQDQRNVSDMYLVTTNVGAPKLEAWKYPLPGDKEITKIQRVIIDVDRQRSSGCRWPPDQHRSTLCDDISCCGGWDDV